MDTRELDRRSERGRGRQNGAMHRRPYNGRSKRSENGHSDDFGSSFQTANGHVPVGPVNNHAQNSLPELLHDAEAIERRTFQLSNEIAQQQQELEFYREKLADRVEVQKVKSELLECKAKADESKQYFQLSLNHLEERLKAMEKEGEHMRARLLQNVTRNEEQDQLNAQLQASEKEKASRVDDLTRKLAQAHASAEHQQALMVSLEQRLKSAEEASQAKEAEIMKLQQVVQAKSDTRQVEEAAQQRGYQVARSELEAMLQKHASHAAALEARVQQAEQEKHNMDLHYQRECDNLCQRINELTEEQKQPLAPLMEEGGLIEMLSSLLPVGRESAVQLGPAFYEQLQRNLWPNTWDKQYAGRHGSVLDFMLNHPQHFGRLPDSEAFFRVGRGICFGTGFGTRLMTPKERTIGPPPSTSHLPPMMPPVASGDDGKPIFMHPPLHQEEARPVRQKPAAVDKPVVVTPFLPEVLAKLNGGQLPAHIQPGLQGGDKPRRGWSQASQARAAPKRTGQASSEAEQSRPATSAPAPPALPPPPMPPNPTGPGGLAPPAAVEGKPRDPEDSLGVGEKHTSNTTSSLQNGPKGHRNAATSPRDTAHTAGTGRGGEKPREPRSKAGSSRKQTSAPDTSGSPPGFEGRSQEKPRTEEQARRWVDKVKPVDTATKKKTGEQPCTAKQPGEPESPEWSEVAPKAQGKKKRGGVRNKAAQLEVPPGAMPAGSRPPKKDGAT